VTKRDDWEFIVTGYYKIREFCDYCERVEHTFKHTIPLECDPRLEKDGIKLGTVNGMKSILVCGFGVGVEANESTLQELLSSY
jgi:5-methylcytosine-specific restriction endonuclease McrA